MSRSDYPVLAGTLSPRLNGLAYGDLPRALQIKLKRQSIRMEVVRKESDSRLRYHMFKRLNSGGEILSPQEVRNCTIRLLDDRLNNFVKKMAEDPHFVVCMSQLADDKRGKMYMEEYALRFFAMKNDIGSYENDTQDFLTQYLEKVSDPERAIAFDYVAEENSFRRTFKVLSEAIGAAAFSQLSPQGKFMGNFSALHFEALTLGIQHGLPQFANAGEPIKARLKEALTTMKSDREFRSLTTGGGRNHSRALRDRIAFVEKRIAACLT